MSVDSDGFPVYVLKDSLEDLYERAPCGYVSTFLDGRIVRVNATFVEWTGYDRSELVSGRRIQDLLSPGSRIFHETHLATLLPVCSRYRKIRSEGGRWQDLETYLQTVGTRVTHGICESCAKDYPE